MDNTKTYSIQLRLQRTIIEKEREKDKKTLFVSNIFHTFALFVEMTHIK